MANIDPSKTGIYDVGRDDAINMANVLDGAVIWPSTGQSTSMTPTLSDGGPGGEYGNLDDASGTAISITGKTKGRQKLPPGCLGVGWVKFVHTGGTAGFKMYVVIR